MMEQKTLTAIFESNKSILKEKLEGLSLPSDAPKIQKIINDYLNEMFNNEGEFRQNLTQAEDYILQAALSLLNAQQAMTKEMTPVVTPAQPKSESVSPEYRNNNTHWIYAVCTKTRWGANPLPFLRFICAICVLIAFNLRIGQTLEPQWFPVFAHFAYRL